jgi:hypothetical protein
MLTDASLALFQQNKKLWKQSNFKNLLLPSLARHGLRSLLVYVLIISAYGTLTCSSMKKAIISQCLCSDYSLPFSVQKAVRDQLEGIPVTNLYYGLAWFATILCVVLMTVGLWNADLLLSEKGFYAMSFILSIFAAIAVQKNTRDSRIAGDKDNNTEKLIQ